MHEFDHIVEENPWVWLIETDGKTLIIKERCPDCGYLPKVAKPYSSL
jgi:hypothetical protein